MLIDTDNNNQQIMTPELNKQKNQNVLTLHAKMIKNNDNI